MRILKLLLLSLALTISMHAYASNPTIYTEEKLGITVTPTNPQFTIKLISNATTGYSWYLREYDHSLIMPIKHEYKAPTSQLIGAPGVEYWTFRVKPEGFIMPQQTTLPFVYVRPWEVTGDVKLVVFRVTTQPRL
jgi:predicted secreted protein